MNDQPNSDPQGLVPPEKPVEPGLTPEVHSPAQEVLPAPKTTPEMSKLEKAEKASNIFSNVLVISGIIFGIIQYKQAQRIEQNRITIEAIQEAHSPDFLARLRRLLIIAEPLRAHEPVVLDSLVGIRDPALHMQMGNAIQQAYGADPGSVSQMSAEDFNTVFSAYDHAAGLATAGVANEAMMWQALGEAFVAFQEVIETWPYIAHDTAAMRTPNRALRSAAIEGLIDQHTP